MRPKLKKNENKFDNTKLKMKRKLQVFISSTYSDLINERQAAVESVLRAGHIPAGMELFSAGSETQLEIIKRWIDDSDIYMLLLGGRYGSIEPKSQLSYTELEYNYALESGKPIFAIVLDESLINKKIKVKGKNVIETTNAIKYESFKEQVLSRISRIVANETEIKLAILESILDIQSRFELSGWVKKNELPDVKDLLTQIQELSDKNSELEKDIQIFESSRIDKIGDYSYSDLKEILANIKIKVPAAFTNTKTEIESNLLDLFYLNKETFSVGVNNMPGSSNEQFQVKEILSHLRVYDLVEIVKLPNVVWSRFQTSKLGNKFIATYSIEKVKEKKVKKD